jgi:hypothetical protein
MVKTPVFAVAILVAIAAVVVGSVVYNSNMSQSNPVCRDPACISSHVYNPGRLEIIKPTITASGIVEAKREEADGDYHILVQLDSQYSNLTNQANANLQNGWLVVEIICVLPVMQQDAIAPCSNYTNTIPIPNIGDHITFTGPYVLDSEHSYWAEIHPVYSLTIG